MKVKVDGMGIFEISEEFMPELMNWLSAHSGVKVKENNSILERGEGGFTGRELLNG